MKFTKLKNLILPSVLLALSGCGGSGGSDNSTNSSGSNQAPVLNEDMLNTERGSTTVVADIVQWEVTFSESETSFVAQANTGTDFVNYYDIDLLTGISDPDGDTLAIKDVTFIWSGPDCANTLVDAVNFPDVCDAILAEFGVSAGDTVTAEQAADIRELQNRPVVDEPIYGFEMLTTGLRVTPENFAPLLVTGQTAELGVSYIVTDGVNEIQRRVLAIVEGLDAAPVFIQTNDDGSPRLDDNGNTIPIDPPSALVSEKSGVTTIEMAEGLYDQDIYDVAQLEREIGDLSSIYTIGNTYQRQNLFVENFTVTSDSAVAIPAGFARYSRITDPVTGLMVSAEAIIDPRTLASTLNAGDVVEVTVSFDITDGNNSTNRQFTITVVGADDGNNAPLFFDDLSASLSTTANATTFDLTEGVLELESDDMSIVGFMPVDGTDDEYGIFPNLASETNLVVDPVYFTYLQPGESKTFSYTYLISDGSLSSEERRIDITLNGASANIVARAEQPDPGFESGSLEASPWRFETAGDAANLNIIDTDAHSGTYSLQGTEEAIVATLTSAGIQQNQINEGDYFYVSFFAKIVDRGFSVLNVLLNKGDNYDSNGAIHLLPVPALGVVNNWVERIASVEASDYFSPSDSETFSLSVVMQNNAIIDDLSIIKFNTGGRTLISNGAFTTPSLQGWSVTGGATIEVNEDANRANNGTGNGLRILNDTASFEELQLDPSFFPQGSIKKGMRYVIQFDMRTPSYTGNAVPIDWKLKEVGGATQSRRLDYAARSATLWTTYHIHIDTSSDSRDVRGLLNNDTSFDWESATVQPVLSLRPGDELQIDNIRMYPVPKY